MVALADGGEVSRRLDYGGLAIFLLAHAAALRCGSAVVNKTAKEEGEAYYG